jgi:uncharacterized RDD family membrane protein YckC
VLAATFRKPERMILFKTLIINPYTKFISEKLETFTSINGRINSTIIDVFFTGFWFMPLGIIFMICRIATLSIFSSSIINPWTIGYGIFMFLLLNKDYYNSRSIGKRITGYKVVDNISGLSASKIQCLIRNITTLLWPIEIALLLTNSSRRLGDFIAGTKVIESDKISHSSTFEEINKSNHNISILWLFLSIIFSSILVIIPELLSQSMK